MAEQTLTRICVSYDEAVQYVYDLERAGVSNGAISIVGSDIDHRLPDAVMQGEGERPARVGAALGGVVGGGVGVLAGLGALVIPGIGPLVAAGWLVTMLAGAGVGAAAGGMVGTLVQAGMGHSDARDIAAAVEDGQYVVLVRIDDAYAPAVRKMLARPLESDGQDAVLHPMAPEPGTPETSSTGVSALPTRVRA